MLRRCSTRPPRHPERLADTAGGLSQAAIAEAVGRSVGQIFRVLQTLESRGYLHRDGASGLYFFSIMTFELANRHDPVRGLRQAALAPMRRLSDEVQQSCNLGMLEAGRILILAQVESPASFGFRVRVGAEFPVESTATGAVLVAFAAPRDRDAPSRASPTPPLPHGSRGWPSRVSNGWRTASNRGSPTSSSR